MTQYIDKDRIVAEIEKLMYAANAEADIASTGECFNEDIADAKYQLCKHILDIINTLEVKEVDLEKEIQDHIKECLDIKFPTTDIELIKKDVAYTAKKFFELGLKAQKGE